MKSIKLLFLTLIAVSTISSCSVGQDEYIEEPYYPTLEEVITEFDLCRD